MNLQPHAELTRTLRILLKITIGVSAVAILLGLYQFSLPSDSTLPSDFDAISLITPSNVVAVISIVVAVIVGWVDLVLVIVTVTTFLLWVYRSNENLRALSGESMTFTPGWSVGWYFIPIVCLWKPYQVMKEIWNVSHKSKTVMYRDAKSVAKPRVRDTDTDFDGSGQDLVRLRQHALAAGHLRHRVDTTNHGVVRWWWALWLISIPSLCLPSSGFWYSISNGFDVILTVVALTLVTRIGAAYSRNIVEPIGAAYVGSATASPPPLTPVVKLTKKMKEK